MIRTYIIFIINKLNFSIYHDSFTYSTIIKNSFLIYQNNEKEGKHYAFIDGQNPNLGIQNLGWKLDFFVFAGT